MKRMFWGGVAQCEIFSWGPEFLEATLDAKCGTPVEEQTARSMWDPGALAAVWDWSRGSGGPPGAQWTWWIHLRYGCHFVPLVPVVCLCFLGYNGKRLKPHPSGDYAPEQTFRTYRLSRAY